MKQLFDKNGTQVSLLQDGDIDGNSEYVKLPDGTLICYGDINITVTEDGTTYGNTTIYYKKHFISSPFIALTNRFSWSNDTIWNISESRVNSFKAYFKKVSGDLKKGNTLDACYIAIGRWK